jgi:ferredoxin
MGLKDLLKSTVKRALGRGEATATATATAPEARPTRSGSHPAPPPWRAAQTAEPVAAPAVAPEVETVVAPVPDPEAPLEEVAFDDQVSQNPADYMDNGALPPGDEPQVAAPVLDVVLDLAAAPVMTPEEAQRREEPQEVGPPPMITPSASHDTVVELHAAPISAPISAPIPAPGVPATGMPEVNPDAEFKVHLINEQEGIDLVITAFVGEPVLDAADRQGLALPYSCRNGGCTICAGKLLSGEADMGDQYVLEPEQIAAGFRLLCCAWVTSDATIITHQNDSVS